MPNFHTMFSPRRVRGVSFSQRSLAQEQFKNEADINFLVGRFFRTGAYYDMRTMMRMKPRQPIFADLVSVPDFQEAQNIIAEATEKFKQLPSKLRERFSNSPELLLAFLNDGSNRDEAVKLGLIPAPAPVPVPEPVKKETPVNE